MVKAQDVSIPLREDILSNVKSAQEGYDLLKSVSFNSPKGRYLI